MEAKKEKNIAFALVIILLVVGVVCYAAYPDRAAQDPVRIMFKNTAGNVLFDHKTHTSESGYGFACVDCHHTLEDPKDRPEACGECHDAESEVKRSDAFHDQCKKCHEDGGAGPVDCSGCHVL